MAADLTAGTGCYNLAQGAASACWSLGAALSNSLGGLVAEEFGFTAAFLVLAGIAFAAFLLFWLAVPETGRAAGDAAATAPALREPA